MKCVLLSVMIVATVAWSAENPNPDEQQCQAHLHALGQALKMYLIYNDGNLPARISELYKQGFVLDLDTFCCPASGTRMTDPAKLDEQTDYLVTTNATDEKPLLLFRERSGFHTGKALAFYSDRSIRMIDAPPPPSPPVLTGPTNTTQTAGLSTNLVSPAVGSQMPPVPTPSYASNATPSSSVTALPPQVLNDRAARFQRASEFLWKNRLQEARDTYAALGAAAPNDFESRRLHASLEMVVGDPRKAVELADVLVKARPNDSNALLIQAQAALYVHDTATAQRIFPALTRLKPSLGAELYDQANQFLTAGVPALAVQLHLSAVWLDPRLTGAYYGLGLASAQLGQRDQAIAAFNNFLQSEPTSPFAEKARQQIERLKATP